MGDRETFGPNKDMIWANKGVMIIGLLIIRHFCSCLFSYFVAYLPYIATEKKGCIWLVFFFDFNSLSRAHLMYAFNSPGKNQDRVWIFKQGPLCCLFYRIITVFVWVRHGNNYLWELKFPKVGLCLEVEGTHWKCHWFDTAGDAFGVCVCECLTFARLHKQRAKATELQKENLQKLSATKSLFGSLCLV